MNSQRCRFRLLSQLLEQYFDSDFDGFSSGLFGFPEKFVPAFGTFLFLFRLFRFDAFLRRRFKVGVTGNDSITPGTSFVDTTCSSVKGIAAIPISIMLSKETKNSSIPVSIILKLSLKLSNSTLE